VSALAERLDGEHG
jgi:hypothetical protein